MLARWVSQLLREMPLNKTLVSTRTHTHTHIRNQILRESSARLDIGRFYWTLWVFSGGVLGQ